MATTEAEVAAALQALTVQVNKIKGEVAAKLQALADAIANQGNVTPEVEAALAELQAAVGQVDDLNPDDVTPPAEEPIP